MPERTRKFFKKDTPVRDSPGVTLPEEHAKPPHEVGLTTRETVALKSFAVRTGFDVYVRDNNPARLLHIRSKNTRPKPVGLYTKTDKSTEFRGLVRAKETPLVDKSGLGFVSDKDTGLVRDRQGDTVHSDIDLHRVDIHGKTVLAPEYLPKLNSHLNTFSETSRPLAPDKPYTELRVHPRDKIQHPAHDEWEKRNDKKYSGGINFGPQPGVTRFSAKGRDVHFSTTKEYKEELRRKKSEHTYTQDAWDSSAHRDPGQIPPVTIKKY